MALLRNNILISVLIFLIALLLIQSGLFEEPAQSVTPYLSPILGERTQAEGCIIENNLPDPDCTPGSIFSEVTREDICTSGYARSVRNVSQSLKNDVYLQYGIIDHKLGEYFIDHLISLQLGGSNDIANLWPLPSEPRPGFHEKIKVENYLHDRVCDGTITLQQAQEEIVNNWLLIFSRL